MLKILLFWKIIDVELFNLSESDLTKKKIVFIFVNFIKLYKPIGPGLPYPGNPASPLIPGSPKLLKRIFPLL